MANNSEIAADSIDLSDDLLYEWARTMDPDDVNMDQRESEEQCLSQKLSQLSASEATDDDQQPNKRPLSGETSVIPKKMKVVDDPEVYDDHKGGTDNIPNYLSMNHPKFQQLIQSILSTTANSITMQELQEITLWIRQMMMIDLQKLLWNTYLQSGTGDLTKEEHQQQDQGHSELFLWPMEMKLMMMKEKANERIDLNQMDHTAYLNYVHRTLYQLADRQMQYQTQFDEKKYTWKNFFTAEMEQAIRQFIEQQEMIFIRLDFQRQMAIVRYDYRDRLLELEYHQLKPNQSQLHLFENLTRMKQEKEKSKYEVELLKQRLRHGYLPEPLHSLQLPLPISSSSLDKITDPNVRQHLLDRHTKTIEQTKLETMEFYITTAEVQIQECQLKFDQHIVQMRSSDQPLTPSMVQLVERHLKNIDKRLEYLYKLKIRFLEEQINKRQQHHPHPQVDTN